MASGEIDAARTVVTVALSREAVIRAVRGQTSNVTDAVEVRAVRVKSAGAKRYALPVKLVNGAERLDCARVHRRFFPDRGTGSVIPVGRDRAPGGERLRKRLDVARISTP